MASKAIGAAAAGAALVLFGLAVFGGGGPAAGEQPPEGGCVVATDPTGPAASGGGVGPGTTSGSQKTAELNATQMAAARTVAGVGRGMGIAERGIAIALGTAMQESTMDPTVVSGRAVGLFQQQGELYRGVDRADPAAASGAFYQLLVKRVPNYADPAAGTFADIAQEVQKSGAGAIKYAPWEHWATALARELINGTTTPTNPTNPTNPADPSNPLDPSSRSGSASADESPVSCEEGGGSGPKSVQRAGQDVTLPAEAGIDAAGSAVVVHFPTEEAAIAAAAALSYLGTTYAWGGGGPNGPSPGIRDGGVADRHGDFLKVGFDCSGLTEYAYAQAGIAIGGDSRTQYARGGTRHPFAQARPGDLVFAGDTPAKIHHVAIYLGRIFGREYVVESPQSGSVVKVSSKVIPGDLRVDVVRPSE